MTVKDKFFSGFCFAFGLVVIILAPILLFSGINPIMTKNPIYSAEVQIELQMNSDGNRYNIFKADAYDIVRLKGKDIDELNSKFSPLDVEYNVADMQKMQFSPFSETSWTISPPMLEKFIKDFDDIDDAQGAYITVRGKWIFNRENPVGAETASGESIVKIPTHELTGVVNVIKTRGQNNTDASDTLFI